MAVSTSRNNSAFARRGPHLVNGQYYPPVRPELMAPLANEVRATVLTMIHLADSGHVGSSLSCVDLVTVLKFDQMDSAAGDVFVLSKGHAAPTWYAALLTAGELDRAEIGTLRQIDSRLQGHPDRTRLPAVAVSTGALGQGLSVALGRSEAKRLKGEDATVYCLVGDGELQEGQMWEALMYAGVRQLANTLLIVDHNRSQNDGPLDEVLPLHALPEKLRAFQWHVQEVDGHCHTAIRDAISTARTNNAQPSVIIAHTLKGYLGPERILLNGTHSGVLSAEEYENAVVYLRRQQGVR
ncbi:transketolase [Micromonospora pallida]|uniref:Transketolase n=1 Tax=Micromonospora pallida TaxID=145854 RepID=A0A1C6RU66_9ACTN|nr:transketolase [Micromonospora pallida]SCL20761.1 transketolase [Micromonospora pallida]